MSLKVLTRPADWPLWAWTGLTVVAALLEVDYSLGAFSLAPAVALMAGSFLGPRRGALSQAAALPIWIVLSLLVVGDARVAAWGYGAGRIALAAMSGQAAPASRRVEKVSRKQAAVLAALAVAVGFVLWRRFTAPGSPQAPERYFAAVFALAIVIGLYYTWRIVPEVGRVIAYLYSLLPYYGVALIWLWALSLAAPARVPGIEPGDPAYLVFHGFLAHLPPDSLMAVLAAYLASGGDGRRVAGRGRVR